MKTYRVTQKKGTFENPTKLKHFMAKARCWPFHWSMITKLRGCL
jgi:hypothetical protein